MTLLHVHHTTSPSVHSMYDAVHSEVLRATGGEIALLVHVGRTTAEGFQVIEVRDSQESCDA